MGSNRGGTRVRTGLGLKLITLMLIFVYYFSSCQEGGGAAAMGFDAVTGEVCVLDPRDIL